jgi:uncharacterized membrane protein
MKHRFLTGLIIILPVTITVWVISFLVHLCTKPFQNAASALIEKFDLFQSGWWIFSEQQLLNATTTLSILISLFIILFVIGFIGQWFFFHIILKAIDRMMLKVPVVNKVYKACREFTDVLFSPKSTSFSRVVWSPFPTPSQGAIGLVTNEVTLPIPGGTTMPFTAVLIPGTPNPTVGFLVMCPKNSITPTSLGIDTAMKWVISCGSSETTPVMETTHDIDLQKIYKSPLKINP